VIVDTSVVVAFMNRGDRWHREVVEWLDDYRGSLVTSPLAVAEIDHLVGRLGGAQAQLALWDDLERGAYRVEWWPAAMYETIEVAREHAGFEIGLTDASLAVLARRLKTVEIATLDERHFRILRPLGGEDAYRLFPADRG
jgi:predicted nucleic acid-binding protein